MLIYIEDEHAADAPQNYLRSYRREEVAAALDQINDLINAHPDHYDLAPVQRAEWAAFPAQARSHRYPTVTLDPNHPIAAYMRSGFIGPSFAPSKSATEEKTCK